MNIISLDRSGVRHEGVDQFVRTKCLAAKPKRNNSGQKLEYVWVLNLLWNLKDLCLVEAQ